MAKPTNNGDGIFGQPKEKVFDRFYRGHSLSGEVAAGHGLGLSIAREIGRAHNGDVTLLHSDRQWTEFCMTLPIANDSDGMQGDTSTKQSVSQTSWLSRSVERELEAKTYKNGAHHAVQRNDDMTLPYPAR